MQDWTDQRVFVTGATGLVGSWLTRRLVDEGARVTVLVRDADPQSELLRSGTIDRVSVVSGDLDDADTVERGIVGAEAGTVVHLGAQTLVGTAHRMPLATLTTNIMGTAHVLEAARRHGDLVRRVVVASSDKAYGTSCRLPYTEDQPLDGRAPYEVSKSATDLLCASYASTYGVPVAVARCGNIFGGGDLNWSRIVPGTIRDLLQGRTPVLRSNGTHLRDYLHVDDVVDAYLALAGALVEPDLVGEAFNFSDERPRSVLDVYAAVCEATVGHHVEPVVLDRAVGEIQDQYLDAAKARRVLSWKPGVTLEQGLQRTVAWYADALHGAG